MDFQLFKLLQEYGKVIVGGIILFCLAMANFSSQHSDFFLGAGLGAASVSFFQLLGEAIAANKRKRNERSFSYE